MEIIKINSKDLFFDGGTEKKGSAVALGMFDGVHLGHAEVITRTVSYAAENNLACIVWNLRNAPLKGAFHIWSAEEKIDYIAKTFKPDYIASEDFENISHLSHENFVRDILIDKLNCAAAVSGGSFRYGHGRTGNFETLREQMQLFGRTAIAVDDIKIEDTTVSSSLIRKLLETGDMRSAGLLLGHPYSIYGKIVSGRGIGHQIGIPTINQHFEDKRIIPARGVYITRTVIDGTEYKSVSNIGIRPTVDNNGAITLETHIINYGGTEDLHEKYAKINFISFIRPEIKFNSVKDLIAQINSDVKTAELS